MDRRVVLVAGGFVVGVVIAVLAWPRAQTVHHERIVLERVIVDPAPAPPPRVRPLQRSGLRGTIVNIESKPIVGRISIKNLPTLTTDATGRFELDLPPGTYEVGADLPGRMMSELVVEPGRFTEFRMVTADGRIRLRAR